MAITMKQARIGIGLSQGAMAKQMGCSYGTYRIWEQHPEKMSIANAKKFCALVGVCIEDLNFFAEEVELK